MSIRRRLCTVLAFLLLAACALAPQSSLAAPKKKGKRATARAQGKKERGKALTSRSSQGSRARKGKKGYRAAAEEEGARGLVQASYERGAPQTRATRHGKFGRRVVVAEAEGEADEVPADSQELSLSASSRPTAPDRIEVIEHGADQAGHPSHLPPRPRAAAGGGNVHVSHRRLDVSIDPDRVVEIQQALAGKGFYAGEPTGSYDEATVDAMRRFQFSNRIDVTGYPTAHSLKRLGLTSW